MEHTLYLVMHKDFGWSSYASIHATEAGARERCAQLFSDGVGGMHVMRRRFDDPVKAGMQIRVSTTTSPFDEDYLDVWTHLVERADHGTVTEVQP